VPEHATNDARRQRVVVRVQLAAVDAWNELVLDREPLELLFLEPPAITRSRQVDYVGFRTGPPLRTFLHGLSGDRQACAYSRERPFMTDDALRSLYICYLSLEDPLVHSQVVAYLEGLVGRGHTVHLLTFEPELDGERRREFRDDLARRGITWHSLRYHKRPSLPATIYDVIVGSAFATRLVRRHKLNAIHARSHVPAASALIARRLTGCRFLFDMRGLMAEEYADAGRWKPDGIPFRITKRIEAAAIRAADAMVVLTHAVRDHLFGTDTPLPLEIIPCCADLEALDAQRDARGATRAELDAGDRPILLYVGKFTGWYMEQEMVEFFAVARSVIPELLFVIVTQADREPAEAALAQQRIGRDDFRITSAAPGQIGRYLAAADAGIAFIRPCLSKISSSPTKVGEYLGAGLPVVSGRGIGDVDQLLSSDAVGVLVDDFGEPAYRAAARRLAELIAEPDTGERCRDLAHKELSLREVGIPRYDDVYRRLAG
jgi:glycosyltransferase involved in cell wall biosynthesis